MVKNTGTVLVFFILFFSFTNTFAAFEYKGCGTGFLAGGSSGIASQLNDFGVFINPAKIASLNRPQVELFYRNFYGISDLNQIVLNSQFSAAGMPLGLGISKYGNKIYSETEIRFGYAYKIFDAILIGGTINTYHLEIQNYGSATGFGFDVAALYSLAPGLSSAFVVSNLNEPKLGERRERIPAYIAMGISYCAVKDAEISFDIIKEAQFDFDYRFGINYRFREWLVLSSGFRDQVNSISAGFSLTKSQMKLGYAFVYHPQLGGSNSISMGYEF